MILIKNDDINRFRSVFNTNTGDYIRSGIIDDNGKETNKDPFMTSFPELIDIGIMGSCIHGQLGLCKASDVQCYQDGLNTKLNNMSLTDYKKIIDECAGKTFQVALGGRGDPDQHEHFDEILRYTKENNIVPNYTTSGIGLTKEHVKLSKKYCGAVAVSWYSRLNKPELALRDRCTEGFKKVYKDESDIPVLFTLGGDSNTVKWNAQSYVINGEDYRWDELHHMYYSDTAQHYGVYKVYNEVREHNYTIKSIQNLVRAGVTTNIHFVLSNSSIEEAILRLKYNGFPKGINAVIFLLHKPVGLGQMNEVLTLEDPRLIEFFDLIEHKKLGYKVGFDYCTVPGLLNMCKSIDRVSMETCEAARWSMYITSGMIALPCSFDNQAKVYGVDLNEVGNIQTAWDSNEFNAVRRILESRCSGCKDRGDCLGGCPLMDSITLCNRTERKRGS